MKVGVIESSILIFVVYVLIFTFLLSSMRAVENIWISRQDSSFGYSSKQNQKFIFKSKKTETRIKQLISAYEGVLGTSNGYRQFTVKLDTEWRLSLNLNLDRKNSNSPKQWSQLPLSPSFPGGPKKTNQRKYSWQRTTEANLGDRNFLACLLCLKFWFLKVL